MKQTQVQNVNTVIFNKCDDLAEICFFQDKQYGKIDQEMFEGEIVQIIKDIWTDYKKLITKAQLKKQVLNLLTSKQTKFTLSCKN